MDFSARLELIGRAVAAGGTRLPAPFPAIVLFFSVSDGDARARLIQASGASLEIAWQDGSSRLRDLMARERIAGKWLRVDWVTNVEATNWALLRARLRETKRNYFREGLALDVAFEHAFPEQEINANAMLYGGNRIEHAIVNEGNFSIHAKKKYGQGIDIDFADQRQVFTFSTLGAFCDADGVIHALTGRGLNTGRRRVDPLTEPHIRSLVGSSSGYLAGQVQADGTFVYGYHPCFDRRIEAYNTLRHASTTYSMIEAWEVTRDEALKAAIDRSLDHLTGVLIRKYTLDDGSEAAFLVDRQDEIKLGGNAVAILALAKYSEMTGTEAFHPLMEGLALGVRFMQDAGSGAFVHVLNARDLTVKQGFRTIYYEGEAAFGLMRLYALTGDQRWLDTVEKAFDHFIAKEHWKHHDHWLGYCVNELTRHRPHERYFRFGIQNIATYLDFVLERITTFPTLLELMMAARDLLLRIGGRPDLHHLFAGIDLRKFQRALDFRAHYLLNGHFWPEMAMYFAVPQRIVGSFFIRHHAFRVRIDDVEHYLSGFIAYRRHLLDCAGFQRLVKEHAERAASIAVPSRGWTSAVVQAATRGTWTTPPAEDWSATGLCIYAPAMQPGNMVVARSPGSFVGILPAVIQRMQPPPAAIIVSDPKLIANPKAPVLLVDDCGAAVLGLGKAARDQMLGKVLAVTGSAGKTTTVAMLTHALAPWGPVAKSAHNANLPHGVAWNLASIAWGTPHVVLELAIGRMAHSSRMARPHVALVTNISPAHLGAGSTINAIARTKAAIFLGMAPGDIAVLNRDMLEWKTVHDAARAKGLTILHYGTAEDCEFRLLDYADGRVRARIRGRDVEYGIGAAGTHMAMNSLAVLAAISALGHPVEPALAPLATFSALPGRGEKLELSFGGRRLVLVDDAYNANPGSMRAALDRLNQEPSRGRRIAVLGQMADLGPEGEAYHTELAMQVEHRAIDRYYVTGELYAGFWQALPDARRGGYAASLEELKPMLRSELTEGDVVLFKGSHSTRMHELVAWIKDEAAASKGATTGVASVRPQQEPV